MSIGATEAKGHMTSEWSAYAVRAFRLAPIRKACAVVLLSAFGAKRTLDPLAIRTFGE